MSKVRSGRVGSPCSSVSLARVMSVSGHLVSFVTISVRCCMENIEPTVASAGFEEGDRREVYRCRYFPRHRCCHCTNGCRCGQTVSRVRSGVRKKPRAAQRRSSVASVAPRYAALASPRSRLSKAELVLSRTRSRASRKRVASPGNMIPDGEEERMGGWGKWRCAEFPLHTVGRFPDSTAYMLSLSLVLFFFRLLFRFVYELRMSRSAVSSVG